MRSVVDEPSSISAPWPPGPRGWWRTVAGGWSALHDTLGHTTRLAAEHGDLVRLRAWPFEAYQVGGPQLIQELLVHHAEQLQKPARLRRVFHPWLGEGLLFSEGATWRRQRRLVEAALRSLDPECYVADAVVRVRDEARRRLGEIVDFTEFCERVAFHGLLRSLFSDVTDEEAEEAYEDATRLQLDGVLRMTRPLPPRWAPTPGNRRFHRALRRFREFIRRHLERRQRDADGGASESGAVEGDLVDRLIALRQDGYEVSDDELFHVVTNLLFGGKAGVASLTWLAHALSEAPETQRRVHQELDAALAGALPRAVDLPRLPYLQMATKESFRLYPPVPMVTREPLRDIRLGEHRVRRGAFVYAAIIVMQRDPRWFPDPLRFEPERFAPGRHLPAGAYVPFGVGPHACVGRSIALAQVPCVMGALLSTCRLERPAGEPQPTLRIDERLHPAGPLRLRLAARDDATQTNGHR